MKETSKYITTNIICLLSTVSTHVNWHHVVQWSRENTSKPWAESTFDFLTRKSRIPTSNQLPREIASTLFCVWIWNFLAFRLMLVMCRKHAETGVDVRLKLRQGWFCQVWKRRAEAECEAQAYTGSVPICTKLATDLSLKASYSEAWTMAKILNETGFRAVLNYAAWIALAHMPRCHTLALNQCRGGWQGLWKAKVRPVIETSSHPKEVGG